MTTSTHLSGEPTFQDQPTNIGISAPGRVGLEQVGYFAKWNDEETRHWDREQWVEDWQVQDKALIRGPYNIYKKTV